MMYGGLNDTPKDYIHHEYTINENLPPHKREKERQDIPP